MNLERVRDHYKDMLSNCAPPMLSQSITLAPDPTAPADTSRLGEGGLGA